MSTASAATAAPAKQNGANNHVAAPTPATTNGRGAKKKTAEPPAVDPVSMYESVRSRIAALEEEEGLEEEEDNRMAEQARSAVKGMSDSAIHARYIELYQQIRRNERDHARERQKLTKDKDTAKTSLTKANQAKTKLENIARELQKENKRLREDSKRLLSSVEDAQEVIENMKSEIERRVDDVKNRREDIRDQLKSRLLPLSRSSSTTSKSSRLPNYSSSTTNSTTAPSSNTNTTAPTDSKVQKEKEKEKGEKGGGTICVRVICKYRAELYFKITRQTKFERLFKAWASRMDTPSPTPSVQSDAPSNPPANAKAKSDAATTNGTAPAPAPAPAPQQRTFIYTHNGRPLADDATIEDAGVEDGDSIVAVELVDLTESVEEELVPLPQRDRLRKNWTDDPTEAKKAIDEIFDAVVRSRLEDLLAQYELRERHFEAVIRSKQLELLLAKARADEMREKMKRQEQIVVSTTGAEQQSEQLLRRIEAMQRTQSRVMDKLVACCNEPNGERLQHLLSFLREELKRRGVGVDGTTPSAAEDLALISDLGPLDLIEISAAGDGAAGVP